MHFNLYILDNFKRKWDTGIPRYEEWQGSNLSMLFEQHDAAWGGQDFLFYNGHV